MAFGKSYVRVLWVKFIIGLGDREGPFQALVLNPGNVFHPAPGFAPSILSQPSFELISLIVCPKEFFPLKSIQTQAIMTKYLFIKLNFLAYLVMRVFGFSLF